MKNVKNHYPDHWILISPHSLWVLCDMAWGDGYASLQSLFQQCSTLWLCNGEDVNWIRCLHICPPHIHLHIHTGRHPLSFCTSSPIRWTNRTFEVKRTGPWPHMSSCKIPSWGRVYPCWLHHSGCIYCSRVWETRRVSCCWSIQIFKPLNSYIFIE